MGVSGREGRVQPGGRWASLGGEYLSSWFSEGRSGNSPEFSSPSRRTGKGTWDTKLPLQLGSVVFTVTRARTLKGGLPLSFLPPFLSFARRLEEETALAQGLQNSLASSRFHQLTAGSFLGKKHDVSVSKQSTAQFTSRLTVVPSPTAPPLVQALVPLPQPSLRLAAQSFSNRRVSVAFTINISSELQSVRNQVRLQKERFRQCSSLQGHVTPRAQITAWK